MADSLSVAAVVAGTLTTLGVVLDWGVAPETKKRIQVKLEGLLYRFRYRSWRTFGRDEIEFSMRVFDSFGRFFTLKRLIVVTSMFAGLFALIEVRGHSIAYSSDSNLKDYVAIELALRMLLFSASLSYSAWISRAVLRLPKGDTILGTIVLLILHLLLLIIWPLVDLFSKEITIGLLTALLQLRH